MAHRSALANTAATSCACPSDSLTLVGEQPVEVYVRLEGSTPQFSKNGDNWYSSICWRCQQSEQYALIITYHLASGLELKPSTTPQTLYFSPIITEGTNHKQIGYLPWSGSNITYHIGVSDDSGNVFDPEIIVTPIEADPGNGGR